MAQCLNQISGFLPGGHQGGYFPFLMVKLHVFILQLTDAHRMDAFSVHMPDNAVDLLEVGQREVKPLGNEELPSLSRQ